MTLMEKVLNEIDQERNNQIQKFGYQDYTTSVWLSVIGEEFGEMCKEANDLRLNQRNASLQNLYDESIQTAACCVALCENILNWQTDE